MKFLLSLTVIGLLLSGTPTVAQVQPKNPECILVTELQQAGFDNGWTVLDSNLEGANVPAFFIHYGALVGSIITADDVPFDGLSFMVKGDTVAVFVRKDGCWHFGAAIDRRMYDAVIREAKIGANT